MRNKQDGRIHVELCTYYVNKIQTRGRRGGGDFVGAVFGDRVSRRLDVFRSRLFERQSAWAALTATRAAVSVRAGKMTDGSSCTTTISALNQSVYSRL